MQLRYRKKRRVSIDISSMIDVVFLLLLFFLVTSTFLEAPGINLDLPDAKSSSSEKLEDLKLVISRDHQILFNGIEIKKEDFRNKLQSALQKDNTKTLIIEADEKTDYGLVVYFIDVARLVGIKNLIIATESAENTSDR
ncbi:MAG: hypothetical protein A2161_21020 [Candidatus Schekmanbacteria bacterium RBG_13_48_7]|uniref:Biopolymer transporter ExbD n=1 Tax=Candidatus Schekmanbacteria bacterium RBG_13_48_7 TaxID=1817878 RepID=A0A1F7RRA5_9BACT|nr:MAG: hypothetical protein A2161_21020 [Candidatus Schekmanbacteria bacterium RBG_13_48_7]